MTTSKTEVSARLLVTGIFDPSILSETLGLQPDLVWRSDEAKSKGGMLWGFDAWCLSSSTDSDMDWPKKLNELMDRIEPHKVALLRFLNTNNLEVEFQCIAYTEQEIPITWFPRELLSRIVALSANLDIDLYVLGEDSER